MASKKPDGLQVDHLRVKLARAVLCRQIEPHRVQVLRITAPKKFWMIEGVASHLFLALSKDKFKQWSDVCDETAKKLSFSRRVIAKESAGFIRDLVVTQLIEVKQTAASTGKSVGKSAKIAAKKKRLTTRKSKIKPKKK